MPTTTSEHAGMDESANSRSPWRNEIFLGFIFAIGCATILAIMGNFRENQNTAISTPEMFRLSNGLVTGALGFFAGSATAWARQRTTNRSNGQPATSDFSAGVDNPNP